MSKSKKEFYPHRKNKNIITKKIILALAAPILLSYEALPKSQPWARGAYSELRKELLGNIPEEINEEKIRESLYNLRHRNYFKLVEIKDKNQYKIELTKKGQEVLRGYQFEDLVVQKSQKWDGKWRFVMFDIPERNRYARDIFRDKLEKMNFFRVQQSVWVYPYKCEKEIEFISEYLGIKGEVLIFTGKVNKDSELKVHFRKLGIKLGD